MDEGSAGVAKDALHNYKLDGENKIKVRYRSSFLCWASVIYEIIVRRLHSQENDDVKIFLTVGVMFLCFNCTTWVFV